MNVNISHKNRLGQYSWVSKQISAFLFLIRILINNLIKILIRRYWKWIRNEHLYRFKWNLLALYRSAKHKYPQFKQKSWAIPDKNVYT